MAFSGTCSVGYYSTFGENLFFYHMARKKGEKGRCAEQHASRMQQREAGKKLILHLRLLIGARRLVLRSTARVSSTISMRPQVTSAPQREPRKAFSSF